MKVIIILLLILVFLYMCNYNVTTETYCDDSYGTTRNCENGCGRPYAGASDTEMICCPNGISTYPPGVGFDYCKDYIQPNIACWLDEMCVNGNCKGNGQFGGIAWSGKGTCN